MKYRATFVRTESYQYYVDVDADDEVTAKEKAYEIYNDCDLDQLEHYCLEGNDRMTGIDCMEQEDV